MATTKHSRSVGFCRALCALMILVSLLLPIHASFANDIQITNLTVHPHSGGNGEVEFDITWSNSWRVTPPLEPYNWDAAWVFCKIRRNGGDWTHLKLSTTGHTIPSTPQAITTAMGLVDPTIAHDASTNPAVGIFMYRTNDGFGTFTANDVRLRWSYADNGASSGDVVEIRVLAMEMVYIPEGAFYAGDNATSTAAFREKSTGDNDPWYIGSENAITTTSGTSGNYYYPGASGQGDAAGSVFTIPAAFPKGYGAFYMMKGELSQGQFVAFFNMLNEQTGSLQKSSRDITGASGKNSDSIVYRNNVSWTIGEATLPDQGGGATYSGVAMGYLSWGDLTAYFDWSGLRPMSELEYEKAGRGSRGVGSPIAAVSGEYAWGSTSITGATSIDNSGLRNERCQAGSNIAYNNVGGVQGPVRVGSFAKGANNRELAGAGFYGVVELSGNVWERAVTVGRSEGRSFEGRYHGDGVLAANGDPNVTSWPGTNAVGSGLRGGIWNWIANPTRLSDRVHAASTFTMRGHDFGGRGVRSAP
jgi:formylglycine-generating enzyme required for sulfatase activity